MKNPYNSLGVKKEATQAEIKKAYRKLAMKNHPDRGGDKELFQEMTIAYETLTDDGKRKQYDETGSSEKIDSLDDQAVQLIAVIFSQLIDAADFAGNYVAEVKAQLKHMKAKSERIIATQNKNLNRLVSTLGRVKVDGSDHNIFVSIINQKIEAIEKGLAIESERLVLLDLSRDLIANYSDSKVEAEIHRNPFNRETGGIINHFDFQV